MTLALWGRCQAFTTLFFLITPGRALGTTDQPPHWKLKQKPVWLELKMRDLLFGQQPQRANILWDTGMNFHTSILPSFRPSIVLSFCPSVLPSNQPVRHQGLHQALSGLRLALKTSNQLSRAYYAHYAHYCILWNWRIFLSAFFLKNSSIYGKYFYKSWRPIIPWHMYIF